MPNFHTTDMWSHAPLPDFYIVTTNGSRNQRGELVMGRGAALEAAQRFPRLARHAGEVVRWAPTTYGTRIVYASNAGAPGVGIFQVKYRWHEDADLELIRRSTYDLRDLAVSSPDYIYYLNYPGIGNGRLTEGEVFPILLNLPGNVHIFKKVN